MSAREYLASKAVTLCFLGIGGILFAGIMLMAGTGTELVGVCAAAYLTLVSSWLLVGGLLESSRLRALEKLIEELPEKYLLGEVLPQPADGVEKRYFRIMRELSRSAVGIAEQAMREKEEYCDYVEGWIHEIKTPLTACSLILSNDGDVYKLRRELKRADNLTESILYYARLRTAEKDVKIREFAVAQIMEEAVKSQMELLVAAGISVETEGDFMVSSDPKSLGFILKQLLINCAKYCPGCRVRMTAEDRVLRVCDDGPGIPSHELPRVTERGFTGSGGAGRGFLSGKGCGTGKDSGTAKGCGTGKDSGIREDSRIDNGIGVTRDSQTDGSSGSGSGYRTGKEYGMRPEGGTGMGLYIVSELCARLGISLQIRSVQGEFTCVSLSFS